MGAVYLAEHPLIGKKVALKVIHRELADNKEVVQRFFQEAKAVTKIGNEHIVEIHDFGLATMFTAGASAVKTAAGVLLGTPQYMSPEACESKGNLDHRTDIYALGVLMFQMMTGVLPFDGQS